jgi:hypothetical protein
LRTIGHAVDHVRRLLAGARGFVIGREKKRPFGRLYRTAHFRNCRFATGSVTEFRRGL